MKTRTLVLSGILVALAVAGLISRFASGSPDGLNRVAADHGFSDTERARTSVFEYGSVSGVIGALVVLAVATGLVLVTRRRRRDRVDARRD